MRDRNQKKKITSMSVNRIASAVGNTEIEYEKIHISTTCINIRILIIN